MSSRGREIVGLPVWDLLDGPILQADCIEAMAMLPAASVDAIVCDPPYLLNFMGKAFDSQDGAHNNPRRMQEWHEAWATVALRVLKPGGHLVAAGGSRTYHRLACAIEDAGFEIRDTIAYMYGSGFPKSLDVSKAIDKAAGAAREVVGRYESPEGTTGRASKDDEFGFGMGAMDKRLITAPTTPEAAEWKGWGTALKPAHEPIVVARKPLTGTVAANVTRFGTGALNIDACRIAHDTQSAAWVAKWSGHSGHPDDSVTHGKGIGDTFGGSSLGRWPANVVLDEQAAQHLDTQTGLLHSQDPRTRMNGQKVTRDGVTSPFTAGPEPLAYGDTGGASRFLYVAKASSHERSAGLEGVIEGAVRNTHPLANSQTPQPHAMASTTRDTPRGHHP